MINMFQKSVVVLIILMISLPQFSYGDKGKTSEKKPPVKSSLNAKRLSKDPSLYISASEAKKALSQGKNGILVDVRSAEQFSKVHMTGAINIPANFIRTKTFLQKKTIIIVDTGYNTRNTESECRKLIDEGFNALILQGGIVTLNGSNAGFSLQSMQKIDLTQITPEIFHQEKDYDHYVIIDSSEKPHPKTLKLMPGALHLPLATKQIDRELIKNKTVIAFTADGKQYEKIKDFYRKLGVRPVLYLEGGVRAYAAYLRNAEKSLKPESERKVSGGPGCKSCGE